MSARCVAAVTILIVPLLSALVVAQEPVGYEKDIRPIFSAECVECHGPTKPKKGLDLTENGRVNLLERESQVEREYRLLVAGDPDASYLWVKLENRQKKGKGMPRTLFGARRLSSEQLALIKRWIGEGARP